MTQNNNESIIESIFFLHVLDILKREGVKLLPRESKFEVYEHGELIRTLSTDEEFHKFLSEYHFFNEERKRTLSRMKTDKESRKEVS